MFVHEFMLPDKSPDLRIPSSFLYTHLAGVRFLCQNKKVRTLHPFFVIFSLVFVVFLHVLKQPCGSGPIIEHSSCVRFAPYTLNYPALLDQLKVYMNLFKNYHLFMIFLSP
jgi:hypothetical protein